MRRPSAQMNLTTLIRRSQIEFLNYVHRMHVNPVHVIIIRDRWDFVFPLFFAIVPPKCR